MTGSGTDLTAPTGSYLTPAFEHARVLDAMRVGVITCAPDATMAEVARIMATNHVHAVVVRGLAGGAAWGVVTDRDVAAVAEDASDRLAASCASGELVSVAPDDSLQVAAGLMGHHDVSHLIVVDPERNQPLGVISTLDVAGVVAWGCA
jgi:CBS domain-containing protein